MSVFEKAKKYFDAGLWSEYRVAALVQKGLLTPEQYEEITGSPY